MHQPSFVIAAHLVRQSLRVVMLTAVVLVAVGGLAGPAGAAKEKSCAELIVDDWYDNGRVDFVYPLKCYRQAIKSLPPDVKDYSSAKEVIERALADASNRPRVTKPTPISDVGCKQGERCIDPPGGPTDPGGSGGPGGPGAEEPPSAEGETGSSDASSVPIPLLVLGGLALLLLAAGSAGYLARRFGHGADDDGEGGEPPAPA